jgi:hypothetical protein
MSSFATSQKYYDYVYIVNNTNNEIVINMKMSSNVITLNSYWYYLPFTNNNIYINESPVFSSWVRLGKGEQRRCYIMYYGMDEFHDINIYDKFNMVVGELIITNGKEKVLLTKETIKQENIKVKTQYGDTYLYILVDSGVMR